MVKWKWRDLVIDHTTGMLRETVLWSNIGKATMTFSFVWLTIKNNLTEWYVLAYGAIVVLHELGSRYLIQRKEQVDKIPPVTLPSDGQQ